LKHLRTNTFTSQQRKPYPARAAWPRLLQYPARAT